MVRPWSAKPLSHFRKAYPSTTISASSVFFYFCLFFQRIRRDVPLHYAESTEKALAAFFYVQIEINGMKYFVCFLPSYRSVDTGRCGVSPLEGVADKLQSGEKRHCLQDDSRSDLLGSEGKTFPSFCLWNASF